MKKIILLLLIVPFLLNGQTQNNSSHYYYLKGDKLFLELNTKVIYLQSLDKDTAQLPLNTILNNVFSGVYSAKDIGNQYKENHKTIVL